MVIFGHVKEGDHNRFKLPSYCYIVTLLCYHIIGMKDLSQNDELFMMVHGVHPVNNI